MASIDIYVNETTRHAHVILPPTGPLERDHYDAVFHTLAIRNTARFSQAVFPKPEGALHDYEIFAALTERLRARRGAFAAIGARGERVALERLGPRGLVDLGLRAGPYGGKLAAWRGLSLSALLDAPHGVDLGPLEPRLPGALHTKDKKVHLAPDVFLADVPRLLRSLDEAPRDARELVLIGRRELRSNNSWMHNSPLLVKGPRRCTLKMHPSDAAARGLVSGERARVTSRAGTVDAAIDVSDEMMPGVVSLPHGYGHGRPGVRLSVASAHAGVSVNDLTDEQRVDELTANADFGVTVRVERADASATTAAPTEA